MKNLKLFIFASILVVFSCALIQCERDTIDVCEDHCEAARDCYELNLQWFSISKCVRDCRDRQEGYALIGCQRAFDELKDCQADLPCSAWGDVSDRCSFETNSFNNCLK